MKFKGLKIGSVTYLVSEAEIAEAGSLEKAAHAAKDKAEGKTKPKAVKPKIESEDTPA